VTGHLVETDFRITLRWRVNGLPVLGKQVDAGRRFWPQLIVLKMSNRRGIFQKSAWHWGSVHCWSRSLKDWRAVMFLIQVFVLVAPVAMTKQ